MQNDGKLILEYSVDYICMEKKKIHIYIWSFSKMNEISYGKSKLKLK